MCLGVPARVITIVEEEKAALVNSFGVSKWIKTMLVPEVKIEDYVLVHAGHALAVIDTDEAEARIKLWEEMLEKEGE